MRERIDPVWLKKERDLFCGLVRLSERPDIEALVDEALSLVVDLTSADAGYLELYDDANGSARRWCQTSGCSPGKLRDIRALVSRGIVAEALASGQVVHTEKAVEDARFSDRESVQQNDVHAVVCAPVGFPPIGALYLDGRGGRFTIDDSRRIAELFARHLAPLAQGLVARTKRGEEHDPTRRYRERLRVMELVGRSRPLAEVLRRIEMVSGLDVTVLLTGATGTGKNVVARAIHRNGPRADGPFVELNCATLPRHLIESELFGAREGSHSMALRDTPGKIAAAEGGTLFLDEIGDLPLSLQAKLLQVLESKKYFALGSNTATKADVRFVAATNYSLDKRVAEGRFRPDLYYRLSVMQIVMPALAERPEDIGALCDHFCRRAYEEHGLRAVTMSTWAVHRAESAAWPGNVRELANVVEAGVIYASSEGATTVTERHLFPESGASDAPRSLREAIRDFKRRYVREALEAADWQVREAARQLQVVRSCVYKLIDELGLRGAAVDAHPRLAAARPAPASRVKKAHHEPQESHSRLIHDEDEPARVASGARG